MEVTRQNYIDLNWGTQVPSPWTAEDESELSLELQDWDKVPTQGGPIYKPDEEE